MTSSTVSVAAHTPAPTQSSAASNAAAQASLSRLLAKYKTEISSNPSGQDLASLGRQITAAAKALGQHVTLPKASGSASTPANSDSQTESTGSVDLKA